MPRSVVSVEIGCKSVRLAPNGIEVYTKTGVAHIPWRDVKAAALAGRDRREMPNPDQMVAQMKEMQSQMAAAGISTDLLGMMQKSAGQSGPDGDALLGIVRKSLAAQWLGEDFPGREDRQKMQMLRGIVEQVQQSQPQIESSGISAGAIAELKSQMESMGFSVDLGMEMAATHDPLWIVRRDEINCVLIEASGPERDALLTGLRANLGRRWLGEDFTGQQLDKRFCPLGFKRTFRAFRVLAVLLTAVMILVLVSTLALYVLPIATGQLVGLFFEELLAGDWKAAVIVAGLFAVGLLLCFAVNKVMRGWFAQGR